MPIQSSQTNNKENDEMNKKWRAKNKSKYNSIK